MMAPTTERRQVFRSTAALVGGWAWMVFAAANLVDIAIRGRDLASAIATAALLTGCGIAYAVGIRPQVAGDTAGIRVRNPFRDAVLPWPKVQKIDVADSVRIRYSGGEVRVWALPSSPRARAKAARRAERDAARLPESVAKELKGRTPTTFAVEQLNGLLDAHRRDETDRPATRTWSLPALAAVTVPVLVLLALILTAALR